MIYDISVPLRNGMPVWPSDPPVRLTEKSHLSSSGNYTVRLTAMEFGSHTGTHMDAPRHFVDGGLTLDQMPLAVFVGPALVIEVPGAPMVRREDLIHAVPRGTERVLLKTRNSDHWATDEFYSDFAYLEPDAAALLVESNVRLVGIDYLSIDPFRSERHPSHFVLLKQNIVILEGLNLSGVRPGRYQLVALPLRLQNADGAPARAILIEEDTNR